MSRRALCFPTVLTALTVSCAAVALSGFSVSATSPPAPDTDQARVDSAIEAFAAVLQDAGIPAEDGDEPVVADTRIEPDDIGPDLDANPAPECYDESFGDELPADSDVDIAAYSLSRSVRFSAGEGELEWNAFVLTGDEGDPVFPVIVGAMLPESDECVEAALVAQLEGLGDDDAVTDISVDVTSSDDLGVGDTSARLSIVASAIEGGEPVGAIIVTAAATTADGVVTLSARSSVGAAVPDDDLVLEALSAMIEALEA